MHNVGALIFRTGFGGPLCYNYDMELPQNSMGNYLGPYILLGLATGRGQSTWGFMDASASADNPRP